MPGALRPRRDLARLLEPCVMTLLLSNLVREPNNIGPTIGSISTCKGLEIRRIYTHLNPNRWIVFI